MNQSILPEQFEQVTIANLLEGEIVYTLPWAVFADARGLVWINGKYPFYKEAQGTSHLKIEKQGKSIAVHKDTVGDHRYDRTGDTFFGGADPIPVVFV